MAEITKMWIAGKMREIMKHKSIDKIRVTEICRAAEIERPTFYYHFKRFTHYMSTYLFFLCKIYCKGKINIIFN